MYYTYILRCIDNSLYTGITNDLKRRLEEHINKTDKCAKYTLTHQVEKLELAFTSESRILATKLEYHIKKLTKHKKELLIKEPELLKKFLSNKINPDLYNYQKKI